MTSKFSETITVVVPPPKKPKLIKPTNGETNVPINGTTFEWADPGSNTSAKATGFSLKLYEGNNVLANTSTTGSVTSWTSNLILKYETTYSWSVEASNPTGSTPSSINEFTTEMSPPPPPPQQSALAFVYYSGEYVIFASLDGINILDPIPAAEEFNICVGVANFGNAPSEPAQVSFVLEGNGYAATSQTTSVPSLGPGQTYIACVPVLSLQEGLYDFHAFLYVNNILVDSAYYGAWVGF
jgi:hypothetical protein